MIRRRNGLRKHVPKAKEWPLELWGGDGERHGQARSTGRAASPNLLYKLLGGHKEGRTITNIKYID